MTKTLTLSDIHWQLDCLPDDTRIEGNALASGDDVADRAQERWVHDQLDSGNQWAWCTVRLTGRYKGLESVDTLGCCSYLDENDFRQPGGYFDDMQSNVLADLQCQLDELLAECC